MSDPFIPINLGNLPEIDRVERKEDIIEATKKINKIIKDSRMQSKQEVCYYCGKPCDGFCNSHTVPAFCLRNIAEKGKVYYANTIIDLPVMKDDKGVNEAGTFHLICRDCDSKVFQVYENPENYDEQPSIKMLAQISMKNYLKNISKRLMEKELYDLMQERLGADTGYVDAKQCVSDLDLNEYKAAFVRAKKRDIKPFSGEYYIGFYEKLPYVVPVAFQGTVAMIADMEGNVINNVYNKDPKYRIKDIMLCVFPLEDSSVIMLFVEKDNRRYSNFFRQLKKCGNREEQLRVINFILFSYCEDYFVSPHVSKKVLKQLNDLMGKTSSLLATWPTTNEEQLEEIKKVYDFNARFSVPNLFSQEFALSKENDG